MSPSRLVLAGLVLSLASFACTGLRGQAKVKPPVSYLVDDPSGDGRDHGGRRRRLDVADPSLDIVTGRHRRERDDADGRDPGQGHDGEGSISARRAARGGSRSRTAPSASGMNAYRSAETARTTARPASGKFDTSRERDPHPPRAGRHAERQDQEGLAAPQGFYLTSNAVVGVRPAWGFGTRVRVRSAAADSVTGVESVRTSVGCAVVREGRRVTRRPLGRARARSAGRGDGADRGARARGRRVVGRRRPDRRGLSSNVAGGRSRSRRQRAVGAARAGLEEPDGVRLRLRRRRRHARPRLGRRPFKTPDAADRAEPGAAGPCSVGDADRRRRGAGGWRSSRRCRRTPPRRRSGRTASAAGALAGDRQCADAVPGRATRCSA